MAVSVGAWHGGKRLIHSLTKASLNGPTPPSCQARINDFDVDHSPMAVPKLDSYCLRIVEPSMQYSGTKRQVVCPYALSLQCTIFLLRKSRKRYARGILVFGI
jgi:hypothetical protein